MKKLIILTLLTLSFGIIQAQDAEYKAELKTFIKNGNTSRYGKEKFQEIFMQLFQATGDNLPYKTQQEKVNVAVELGAKYYETQAIDDICDIFAPYYAKHLTIDELRTINKTLAEEEYKNVWQKANGEVVNTAATLKIAGITKTIMGSILQGEEPKSTLEAKEKESNFYKKIEKLISILGFSEAFSTGFDLASQNVTDPKQKEFMVKYLSHMKIILPEMFYEIYKEKINEQELNTLLALYEKPEFKKMTNANKELTNAQNLMPIGMEMMKKIGTWLDTQNIINQ